MLQEERKGAHASLWRLFLREGLSRGRVEAGSEGSVKTMYGWRYGSCRDDIARCDAVSMLCYDLIACCDSVLVLLRSEKLRLLV